MAHPAGLLARVLGDLFPGKPNDRRPESPVTHAHPKTPRVVGQGAANETRITIDGVPYLFVDEGDCVVEFEPAFDEHTGDTAFGLKILPELTPHWSMRAEHRCALKEAIATAIRRVGQPASENVPQAGPSTVNDAPR